MQNCDNCFGKKWYAKLDKSGVQMVDADGLRLWRCFRCGKVQTERAAPIPPKHVRTGANILYFDLEVSYSLLYNYGLKVPSKYIAKDNLLQRYIILGWAASYMHETKIYSDFLTSKEITKWNDSRILPRLRELMSGADILAGHNVDGYDVRRSNTRFVLNNMDGILVGGSGGKKTLDTLKIARSKFAFESNTLDEICAALGLRGKDPMSREDWLKIQAGDEKTIAKAAKYNVNDVRQGKAVLKKLQPYSGKSSFYGSVGIE